MTTGTRSIRRNRMILVGLFAIAIVPLLGALLLYESSRAAKPWATTNRGELLSPILSVNEFQLTAVDGVASMVNSGHWWMVVVARDGCGPECQTAAHQLRQVHTLLGRDGSRVKRGFVALGATTIDASLSQYLELARFDSASDTLRAGVYIVDPLGNLVLRYEFRDADKPVLQDLKQLLKVSHIG